MRAEVSNELTPPLIARRGNPIGLEGGNGEAGWEGRRGEERREEFMRGMKHGE